MLVCHLERLMETDAKATGLKDLQGLIWRDGFLSGTLTSHVYPDVAQALAAWTGAGREVRIFLREALPRSDCSWRTASRGT